MYLDFLIEIPDVPGKITTKEKGNAVYVNYEVGREYYPEERRYSIRKHHVYGITVKDRLYLDDEKDRYFTQKTILNVFGMDAAYVKKRAERISEQLKIADNIGR